MKNKKLFYTFALLAAGIFITSAFSSCTKPVPVADFSFTVDEMTVTFTNSSTDAETYAWNFGDGNSSAEANPTHTYAENGVYNVKLTATGEGGDDEVTKVVTIEVAAASPVTIDGDLSDWADVNAICTLDAGAEFASLKNFKVTHDDVHIYVYVEVEPGQEASWFSIFIDADDNNATGRIGWMWTTPHDYMIQGDLLTSKDAGMYHYTGPDGSDEWSWEETAPLGSGLIAVSDGVTVGSNVGFEFSLVREMIPNLSETVLNIGVFHQTETWADAGCLPTAGLYPMAKYNFTDGSITVQ
ncbi:MAG: PKD domain-containing protein [Bacteroidia bacterium]|nr:PKD domain-containing protein [Bacteroidales bacterium]NCD42186.1 PKD domain-containing protein [Bacteroidia bacterium]MDD2322258.1 PKD domain-containing protein [Bacteroidales bacterium]MDD3009760.1 PKD domain-containing protein [Bacteroidales bacterium]MDD3960616.1 PKD domain-containing protein [Bacteroidales bacterium]